MHSASLTVLFKTDTIYHCCAVTTETFCNQTKFNKIGQNYILVCPTCILVENIISSIKSSNLFWIKEMFVGLFDSSIGELVSFLGLVR